MLLTGGGTTDAAVASWQPGQPVKTHSVAGEPLQERSKWSEVLQVTDSSGQKLLGYLQENVRITRAMVETACQTVWPRIEKVNHPVSYEAQNGQTSDVCHVYVCKGVGAFSMGGGSGEARRCDFCHMTHEA